MRTRHLHFFACPGCRADLEVRSAIEQVDDDVIQGELGCTGCGRAFPIVDRVPVFAGGSEYVGSFGWQWQKFHRLQRDSYNGTEMVRTTILKRSGWTPGYLAQKTVLECGCGSGNDTEFLASVAKTVISFDLSQSVSAFAPELIQRENVVVMRADLLNIPVKERYFDIVFCHRVIHHTPEPATSFESIAKHVRPGGELFLECYSRHWKSMMNYKYIWRPLTTRLPHSVVYRLLQIVGPVLYPIHAVMNRLAFLRRLNRLFIPWEYHTRMLKKMGTTLSSRELYEYSLLVTFDALTPTHDNPQHPATIREWCRTHGFQDVETRSINPVVTKCRLPLEIADIESASRPKGASEEIRSQAGAGPSGLVVPSPQGSRHPRAGGEGTSRSATSSSGAAT